MTLRSRTWTLMKKNKHTTILVRAVTSFSSRWCGCLRAGRECALFVVPWWASLFPCAGLHVCDARCCVSQEDLYNGEDIATCPSCTLRIRVIYDEVRGGTVLVAVPCACSSQAHSASREPCFSVFSTYVCFRKAFRLKASHSSQFALNILLSFDCERLSLQSLHNVVSLKAFHQKSVLILAWSACCGSGASSSSFSIWRVNTGRALSPCPFL